MTSPSRPAIVFAPHPDDEVFGCGGAIMLHVSNGDPVRVVGTVTRFSVPSPSQPAPARRTGSRRNRPKSPCAKVRKS
ncbi:PIG-L deacetylase family protein, partial [Methylococcus sp. S2T]|uniref:PIG-L deacetylase family protein n=1 Tax=Methylococcus sp. S2T TaxID=3438967 RepID=UPI003ED879DF